MKNFPIAEFVSFEISPSNQHVVIQSNGNEFNFTTFKNQALIFSVFDSTGRIVKSVHNWLNYLGKHSGLSVSQGTVENYGRTLTYLCRWIEQSPTFENMEIDEVIILLDRFHIVEWLHNMKLSGVNFRTLKNREVCLRQFINWLSTIEGGNLRSMVNSPWGRDNILGYVTKASHASSPKYISTEMVISILSQLHNECERCMFHTQYDTGLRISELISFKLKELPPESMYDSSYEFLPLLIQGVKGKAGSRKERITLISRAVMNRIRRYHNSIEYKLAPDWNINDPDKPVFLTSNQLPWGNRNASKQFKSAVNRSDINSKFSTHWLRHGTAFSVLQSDIGRTYEDRMLVAQTMLGHANLSTTEIYTQIAPALLARLTKKGNALNRLDEAEEIRSATYLPPLKNIERRGHRG